MLLLRHSDTAGGPRHVIYLALFNDGIGREVSLRVHEKILCFEPSRCCNRFGVRWRALIVVAQIIPLGYGDNAVIKAYNQAIPGIVQQRASAGKHITTVDMYTGFTPASMLGSDNVHPNSTGYQFMAAHWYSVISPLLPR